MSKNINTLPRCFLSSINVPCKDYLHSIRNCLNMHRSSFTQPLSGKLESNQISIDVIIQQVLYLYAITCVEYFREELIAIIFVHFNESFILIHNLIELVRNSNIICNKI